MRDMGSERSAQIFFFGLIFLAVLMAGLAILGIKRPRLRYSFFLSFIGCWGFTFFLIPLTAFFILYADILMIHGPLIRWEVLASKAFGIIAFAFILVPLVFAIIGAVKPKRPDGQVVRVLGLSGFFIALGWVAIMLPSITHLPSKAAEAGVKSSLYTILMAAAQYGIDHEGQYPRKINDLIADNYLDSFPQNAFSAEPMKPIEFGASDFEGNFTYVPVIQSGEVTGYYLLGYGTESNPGEDVNNDGKQDHVVIVLSDDLNTSYKELRTLLSVSQPEIQ